jgi:RimJ/RimL family protein N-acetyltransferase
MRFALNTARLSLRHLTADDSAFLVDLMNEPPYIDSIGDRGVRTTADSLRYIEEKYTDSYVRHGFGMYLVELFEDAAPIGICGLVKRGWLDNPDLGFAFLRRYWSKGYATEAAGATLRHARESLKLPYLYGVVSPQNTKSIRLLENLGFQHQQSPDFPGQPLGSRLYRTEFKQLSQQSS